MIDRDHALPLSRQAELLDVSRSSLYYTPVPLPKADLELMRKIDRLHTDYPFAGARMMRDLLRRLGDRIGRRHTGRLMRLMGIEALYRKKRTSLRNPQHPVFPYLLRGPDHRPSQSRVGIGHFIHPDAPGLPLPLRYPRLGDAQGSGLASFQQPHDRLLHRCRRGGNCQVRMPRDLQYGSGCSVHR